MKTEHEPAGSSGLAGKLEAAQRRLVRIGFDLHDGPMQSVAALGADLHHFRGQLSQGSEHEAPLMHRRMWDLQSRLVNDRVAV